MKNAPVGDFWQQHIEEANLPPEKQSSDERMKYLGSIWRDMTTDEKKGWIDRNRERTLAIQRDPQSEMRKVTTDPQRKPRASSRDIPPILLTEAQLAEVRKGRHAQNTTSAYKSRLKRFFKFCTNVRAQNGERSSPMLPLRYLELCSFVDGLTNHRHDLPRLATVKGLHSALTDFEKDQEDDKKVMGHQKAAPGDRDPAALDAPGDR
jgi:hypothetical protein